VIIFYLKDNQSGYLVGLIRPFSTPDQWPDFTDEIIIGFQCNIISQVNKMGLGKQAKVLNPKQIEAVYHHIGRQRNGLRNQVIFLLSVKAGLRAKEIAALRWSMVLDSSGNVGNVIHLTNEASKGNSGRLIPLNRQLKASLVELFEQDNNISRFAGPGDRVIQTERAKATSAQAIVNLFQRWYRDLGLIGCSSHSGRRTFITNTSRKIGLVGGSLRDVQVMVGHKNLQTTQRYIDYDTECQRRVVDLV
jgi:integrase/recombinase XerD